MKYSSGYMGMLIVLAMLWQPGIARQPGSNDEVGSISDPSGRSASVECQRTLSGAIVESQISVQRLIDTRMVNPLDEEIGRIVDLVLNQCGSITHIIVHIGGFMGFGGAYVPVPVDKVRIKPAEGSSWLALVRETRQHLLNEYGEHTLKETVK